MDAWSTPEFVPALLDVLESGRPCAPIRPVAGMPFPESPIPRDCRPRWMDGEQSNTSVVSGESMLIKGYRRLTPGSHPEVELFRYLQNAGFTYVPGLYGALEVTVPDAEPIPFAIVQEYVVGRAAGTAFLAGYRSSAGRRSGYPADPATARQRVNLFVLEKACYESCYEMAHRPDWVSVPLRGVLGLLDAA